MYIFQPIGEKQSISSLFCNHGWPNFTGSPEGEIGSHGGRGA